MTLRLVSIDECLNRSALKSYRGGSKLPMEPVSARIEPHILETAKLICFRHGTTIGEFLRECITTMVNDYQDEKPVE